MSMVGIVVILVIVAAIVWYSLSQQEKPESSAPPRLSPQLYQSQYASRPHLLVDVRSAEEFGTGHIPGATHLALQDLPKRMAALPKEEPIILYCRSGARSSAAAQMLAKAGFENVYDLGGITQWREQGMPVTN